MINYLKHHQIDKVRWDTCIDHSLNRLIYAKSWYLDMVSPKWEALVNGDYSMVMPLPVKRKLFLSYLVQPVFTQQLGIFSVNEISSNDIISFLEHIPGKFFRQIFTLNSSNIIPASQGMISRQNLELDLHKEYAAIYKGFNENTKRNIKKAVNAGIKVGQSEDTGLFLSLYIKYAKEKPNNAGLIKLGKIITTSLKNDLGKIVFARSESGEMVAGAFFLKDLGRIIYLASFTTSEGQDSSAMFLIMDDMIRKHAMTPHILDFEGSMIPGIARFFAGFGAEKRIYHQYRRIGIKFLSKTYHF